MEHFISIIYSGSTDKQKIAECLATSNNSLNENELEFVTAKLGNQTLIRMSLSEAVNDVDKAAESLAMKLFDLGLKDFDIEITEATSGTLRRGMRGEEVKKLQQQLGITADGIFGPATERAVRQFQQNAGIQVDGIVGQQTQSAILQKARPDLGIKVVEPGAGYIDAPYPDTTSLQTNRNSRDVGGTPAKPKEVTRLLVGQLNDYVFDYSFDLYKKYRDTHDVARISDFGNRDNPLILIPKMPIKGQPPTNPQGPLYSSQGIRLDQPADEPEDELVGRARSAIDSADDDEGNLPRALTGIPFWPTNYDGRDTLKATGKSAEDIVTQVRNANQEKNYLEMWRLIHLYDHLYRTFTRDQFAEVYKQIEDGAEQQLKGMTANEKREYGVTPLATTLNDLLPDKNESLEETYEGDDFHNTYGILWYNEDEELDEAEYQGRKVPLGKPMRGDVKKFKVYVKNPKGNVVKVNFGDPNMRIKKSSPGRRKSFRARHNCDNPGPRHKARYWSCRKW